ncbi:hypothetical protein UFOVP534_18 [uncultured Caudovirales phage]|uniref:Uncharacterized protein n=1 Tax=uncultured Caudovirales phage TaxID=2100421 RepID=A0A6J5MPT5_9CAUD|nr:hypothetical protein UFOVP534_18 [uncultured Caudovirales phage]
MSTFSSICHDKEHNDKIDVAHCFVTDQIRIIAFENDNHATYLTPDETMHLIYLLSTAITRIVI